MRTYILITLCTLVLSACNFAETVREMWPGGASPPIEALNELRVRGATFSVQEAPFPDSVDVDAEYVDVVWPHVYAGILGLMVVPTDESSFGNDRDVFFSYSKESAGGYELLPHWWLSGAGTNVYHYIELRSDNTINSSLDEFGGFYYSHAQLFIPTDATHLEISTADKQGGDRKVDIRVKLAEMYAWNRYIKPLIPETQ